MTLGMVYFITLLVLPWTSLISAEFHLDLIKVGFFYNIYYNEKRALAIWPYEVDNAADVVNNTQFFNNETVFYIPDYNEHASATQNEISRAYLNRKTTNYLQVIWSIHGLPELDDMKLLASKLAKQILKMFNEGVKRESFHLLAYSEGHELAGFIADEIMNQSNKEIKLHRVTSLDQPNYQHQGVNFLRVTKHHADFVDAIHTDKLMFGSDYDLAHADFWPNRGEAPQPGCQRETLYEEHSTCSHQRAYEYWAESVANVDGPDFIAYPAKDYNDFCNNGPKGIPVQMGINCPISRGLTPPHRVKSISMATFTPDEIEFLKTHGNDTCAKTWLGLWDPKRAVHQDQRELMIDKYERKRYFLEPASPLKSLANAAKLTPSSNGSSATHSLSSSNNNLSGSNGNIQAMNQKNNSLDNSFQNITLTPPSSRSNGNGNVNGYGPSAISRPNHQQQQPQQNGHHHYDAFSNGLNGFSVTNGNFKSGFNSSTANSETSSCNSNGFTPESDFVADFSSANIFDATSTNSVASSGSASSGTNGYAKIQPITAAQLMNGNAAPLMNGNGKVHNGGGGGGGGGFVPQTNGNSENFADFDHAPIFNAAEFNSKTTTNANNQNRTNNNSISNNIFFTSTNQQQQNNLYSNTMFDISNDLSSISLFSGVTAPHEDDRNNRNTLSKNIFNNCSNSSSMSYPYYNGNASSSLSTSNNCNNPYSGQQQQQQQQKFTPLAMAAHATAMAVLGHNSSSLNNNNINSPFGAPSQLVDAWQQQDSATATATQHWPGLSSVSNNNNTTTATSYNHPLSISVGRTSIEGDADLNYHSNRNSWSLPISNSTTSNSLSSSATFNSSSSLTASPPADRYAALKDLDEQLRESKAVAAAAAAAVATSVVDSFGGALNNSSNANPFKTAVNSQQTPQIANPFQANQSLNPVATSLFGGMPQNPQQNGLTNGYVGGMPIQQQAFYNYTNGFGAPTTNMYPSGPNGCGFGFGTMQQPIATGGGAAFNNPFAATGTLNSNNPFL